MNPGGDLAPLIVTAELPEALQSRADQLRAAHFPPERNHLKAHVTLFHALPPMVEGELRDALAAEARAAPVRARLEGLMNLGRGTALRLSSPAMLDLRERLASRFHGLLTPQDQQVPRLHVTIQNKVAPSVAKALQAALAPAIEPREFAFAGLALHRYRGGPWEAVHRWPFRGSHRTKG
ncbi:2'-5' RNA ligase family protein [Tsuneonella sp. YG55]|uniref:2'-5' RNA ligase family protein n=1 Tax=Tsuneonella litorea TaxID=2976475 RepID=A0A9X2W3T4_9SPHN|nr:2'-5' RNA ligase family protein [Tsuneonella litorea]MCT2559719.1 2'-5' RNA ligase family protein [Tsuneonella litorea]